MQKEFAHVVSGIPVGSLVRVYACGRFQQFEEQVRSGAVAFTATPSAYPIRVSIRPIEGGTTIKGLKVRVVVDASTLRDYSVEGGSFNILITNVNEFNPGKKAMFLPMEARVGPWVDACVVVAPVSEATRAHDRYACETCGCELNTADRWCRTCKVKQDSCWQPTGDKVPHVCGAALYKDTEMCIDHARAAGLIKRGRPRKAPSGIKASGIKHRRGGKTPVVEVTAA